MNVRVCRFFFAAFLLPVLLSVAAHADTYEVFNAGVSRGQYEYQILGITANGTLIQQFTNRDYPNDAGETVCAGNVETCYFASSVVGSTLVGSPANGTPCASFQCNVSGISFDNGSPCFVTVPSFPGGPPPFQASGICNQGFGVPFHQPIYFNETRHTVSFGPVPPFPILDDLGSANVGELFVNGAGDFAFQYNSLNYSEDFLLIDESKQVSATPEPSTLGLLGTGVLFAGLFRRIRQPA